MRGDDRFTGRPQEDLHRRHCHPADPRGDDGLAARRHYLVVASTDARRLCACAVPPRPRATHRLRPGFWRPASSAACSPSTRPAGMSLCSARSRTPVHAMWWPPPPRFPHHSRCMPAAASDVRALRHRLVVGSSVGHGRALGPFWPGPFHRTSFHASVSQTGHCSQVRWPGPGSSWLSETTTRRLDKPSPMQ